MKPLNLRQQQEQYRDAYVRGYNAFNTDYYKNPYEQGHVNNLAFTRGFNAAKDIYNSITIGSRLVVDWDGSSHVLVTGIQTSITSGRKAVWLNRIVNYTNNNGFNCEEISAMPDDFLSIEITDLLTLLM